MPLTRLCRKAMQLLWLMMSHAHRGMADGHVGVSRLHGRFATGSDGPEGASGGAWRLRWQTADRIVKGRLHEMRL